MGIQSLTGVSKVDRTSCLPFGQWATTTALTGDSAYHTLVSISGHGYLDHAILSGLGTSNAAYLRITIDGAVKHLGGTTVAGAYLCGVVNQRVYVQQGYSSTTWIQNLASSNPYSPTSLNSSYVVVKYPYTTGTTPSANVYLAFAQDSIYFTSSLLIEYMSTVAQSGATFSYAGGSY